MYAHHVIDYFKVLLTNNQDVTSKVGIDVAYRAAMQCIQQAQKFHIAIDYTESFFKNALGHTMFHGEFGGVRLPYPITWVDYNRPLTQTEMTDVTRASSKRGLIAVEVSHDIIFAMNIFYLNYLKHWDFGPVGALLFIDSVFKDHKPYLQTKLDSCECLPPILHGFHETTDPESAALPVLFIDGLLYNDAVQCLKENSDEYAVLNYLLLLLQCKNIEPCEIGPPQKINKKRLRKNKTPIFTYKTLAIKPTGKQQKSTPKHLWENRIHLCRGHFKTYTEDAPLFGKFTGRYWWQPSVRGQNADGIVMKNYTVSRNQESP